VCGPSQRDAQEHILEVDAALSGAEARTRYIVTRSRRLSPEAHIIDMGDQLPEDPMRVALLVGEVLQNLRSALDHLCASERRFPEGCPRDRESRRSQ
jgi:hypothetical protein